MQLREKIKTNGYVLQETLLRSLSDIKLLVKIFAHSINFYSKFGSRGNTISSTMYERHRKQNTAHLAEETKQKFEPIA